jgi:hypothetical protein
VTKLDKVKYGEVAEAETVRKMVVGCPATSGSWSSSWPTGCTHAHAALRPGEAGAQVA